MRHNNKYLCILVIAFAACVIPAQDKLPKMTYFEKPVVTRVEATGMPAPFATESASRSSKFVPNTDAAELKIPKGFHISLFADESMFESRSYPRLMAEAPNGDVFVSDSRINKIRILRDENGDGKADKSFVFTEDTVQPFGLAFVKGWLYVANTDSVVRFKYESGDVKASGPGEKLLDLPGLGYNQHWTRNLAVSPDGKKLYVTVGSETNVSVEPDPRRAAISVYNTDGTDHRVFAGGLRNPVGIDFNPADGRLWTSVNERDGLGDDLVPDYVTSVADGGFYGFPYAYIGQNVEPRRKADMKKDLVDKTIVPDVLLTSHSAALGLKFYTGKMFPKEYRGDLFVALHGSWNRQKLTGYKVIRIKFDKKGKLDGKRIRRFCVGLASRREQQRSVGSSGRSGNSKRWIDADF